MEKVIEAFEVYASVTAILLAFSLPEVASAQIVGDNTLPTPSKVNISGKIQTITDGTTVGNHLFHSFGQFNLLIGQTAYFNNATSINNIITRVTGGQTSNIDGTISANGATNLFLINPSGIVFGTNAQLDIGGSFFASTAESLLFEDGSFFSATERNSPPLLTVNVPIGLQYGANSGGIRVEGTGHRLTSQGDPVSSPLKRGSDERGLQVQPGQTLALVGGNVTLDGGLLSADSGRLELGSVMRGQVTFTHKANGWILGYPDVSDYGDIQLSSAALIDASGDGGGGIQLMGRHIKMTDGSLAFLETRGALPGGEINVQASESLAISGTDPNGISSGLRTQTVAAGNSGQLTVFTPSLRLTGGSRIYSVSFSEGNGGNITVEVPDSVQLIGASPLSNLALSGITANAFDSGDGGDISVWTGSLSILDGGALNTGTIGTGAGGNLVVKATDLVQVIGFNSVSSAPTPTRSILSAATRGAGKGGNLTIETARLLIQDGGRVTASTLASGEGGSLSVNASESIEVSGVVPGGRLRSTLSSDAQANLPIQRLTGLPSIPSGAPGTLTIETPRLVVSNQGQVGVNNQGFGDAGDLRVAAGAILLDTQGRITASTASGEGGNITLQVRDSVQLHDKSQITAEADSSGNGGNITINTHTLAVLEGSQISANASQGAGGNINIFAKGVFISPESALTASSQFGVSGTITITNPEVDPNSGLVELPAEVIALKEQVIASCNAAEGNSFIITGSGGLPQDPTAPIRGQTVWVDLQDFSAQEEPPQQASLLSSPPVLSNPSSQIVEATGWIVNAEGNVELVANLPIGLSSRVGRENPNLSC